MLEDSFSEIIELLWITDADSMSVDRSELLEVLDQVVLEDASDTDPKMGEMLGEAVVVPEVTVEGRGKEFRDDVVGLSSVVNEDVWLMLGATKSDE